MLGVPYPRRCQQLELSQQPVACALRHLNQTHKEKYLSSSEVIVLAWCCKVKLTVRRDLKYFPSCIKLSWQSHLLAHGIYLTFFLLLLLEIRFGLKMFFSRCTFELCMHVHTSAFFTCKNSKVQTRSVIFMFILHVNEYISVLEIVPP